LKVGKVAVIGDADSVLGFRGIGITVFAMSDPKEASKKIEELSRDNYQLIFLTENLAAQDPEIMKTYNEMKEPTVILIPSNKGGANYASSLLSDSVKRAVGLDFLNIDN